MFAVCCCVSLFADVCYCLLVLFVVVCCCCLCLLLFVVVICKLLPVAVRCFLCLGCWLLLAVCWVLFVVV